MVALPALVSGLDAELVRLGYKDFQRVWAIAFRAADLADAAEQEQVIESSEVNRA